MSRTWSSGRLGRARLRTEVAFAILAAVLAMLAAVHPTWIETLLTVEPDGGDGSTEWALVLGLVAVAVVSAALAGREHRLLRAAASEG